MARKPWKMTAARKRYYESKKKQSPFDRAAKTFRKKLSTGGYDKTGRPKTIGRGSFRTW